MVDYEYKTQRRVNESWRGKKKKQIHFVECQEKALNKKTFFAECLYVTLDKDIPLPSPVDTADDALPSVVFCRELNTLQEFFIECLFIPSLWLSTKRVLADCCCLPSALV